MLVVGGLAITIIGLPFAIRQLVRYQFMAHVVAVEGLDGRSALRRSSSLIAGRWWHTAVVTTVINAFVAVTGGLIGLLLLVVFKSLPIWLFSGLLSAMYAAIGPLAAIAQTLLYGDAAACSDPADTKDSPTAAPQPA
jgi:hypothetical protein